MRACNALPACGRPDVDVRLRERLVLFCQVYGGVCYRAWPPETVRAYLEWHLRRHTLAIVQTSDEELTGCAVLYPCDPRRLTTEGRAWAFGWEPPDWRLPAVYFADWIATSPGALTALGRAFWKRFPQGRRKQWFCHRHGKLVRIDGTRFVRLLKKG